MPIHDWSRVPAGLFHHFHQDWSIEIARTLNRGRLPKGLSALVERSQLQSGELKRIDRRTDAQHYAARANRIIVKKHLARIVAAIQIVSPGDKESRAFIRNFVETTVQFINSGVHVLVVDVFAPNSPAPFGIHKEIWNEAASAKDLSPSIRGDRILVSYVTGQELSAYVDDIGVGDPLPDMPLFVDVDQYISVPLEATYMTSWNLCPEDFRIAVESRIMPEPDVE